MKILKAFLIIVGIVVALAIGSVVFGGGGDTQAPGPDYSSSAPNLPNPAPQDSPPAAPEKPTERGNALDKAAEYLSTMPLSQKGLIEQLEFEGYSKADATYAAAHVTVDWNDQAAAKAKEYQDTMPLSREGLIEQLKFEGFTAAQAEYGAKSVLGY